MQNQININIAVDVIRALSEKSLCNSIYVMDNSPFDSPGKGTRKLSTRCLPGQTIHWVVYAIDLQTPVAIRRISFRAPDALPDAASADGKHVNQEPAGRESTENPDLKTWTGIVPSLIPGMIYYYQIELQMGNGQHSQLCIDSLSLQAVCPPL